MLFVELNSRFEESVIDNCLEKNDVIERDVDVLGNDVVGIEILFNDSELLLELAKENISNKEM